MANKNINQSIPGALALVIVILLVLAGFLPGCSSPSGETFSDDVSPDEEPEVQEVPGLNATCFQFINEIRLSWAPPGNISVNTYNVYRSLYDNTFFEKIGEVKSAGFHDVDSIENELKERVPYYYYVTWSAVNEDGEHGEEMKPVLGIYSGDGIDFCEPNDRFEDISSKGSFFTADQPMQDAFLYCVRRDSGETQVDTDWYKYIYSGGDSRATVFITIQQPLDSPFLDKEGDRLWFRFYYQDQVYPEYHIDQPVKCFEFDEFREFQGDQELYFTIYPGVITKRPCLVINYTVKVSDELF